MSANCGMPFRGGRDRFTGPQSGRPNIKPSAYRTAHQSKKSADAARERARASPSNAKPPLPRRPVNEYLTSSNTVRIYVGLERKMWTLNEDLLCDRIDYFERAFKGKFKEGETKEMYMPEDNPVIFAKLIDWVYTNHLDCKACQTAEEVDAFGAEHELYWCGLWVLADMLGAKDLAAATIARIKNCLEIRRHKYPASKCGISHEALHFVYKHDSGRYPLKSLMLNELLKLWYLKGYYEEEGKARTSKHTDGHEDMFLDLMEEVERHRLGDECWNKKSCYHHVKRNPLRGWNYESYPPPTGGFSSA